MIALLLAGTVTVLSPEATGADSGDLAATLGAAVDRALADTARYQRVGDTPLLPEELRMALACPRLDADCLSRAGEAAGTEWVLFPRIARLEAGVEVELQLVSVARREVTRRLLRFVRVEGQVPGDPLPLVLTTLAGQLLGDAHTEGAELMVYGRDIRLGDRPLPEGRLTRVRPGAVSLAVGEGQARLRVDPAEVLVVAPVAAPQVDEASYGWLGWTLAGMGVAALGGAAVSGALMARSQTLYDREVDGLEAERLADQGRSQALWANVLLGSGLAMVTSGVLVLVLE